MSRDAHIFEIWCQRCAPIIIFTPEKILHDVDCGLSSAKWNEVNYIYPLTTSKNKILYTIDYHVHEFLEHPRLGSDVSRIDTIGTPRRIARSFSQAYCAQSSLPSIAKQNLYSSSQCTKVSIPITSVQLVPCVFAAQNTAFGCHLVGAVDNHDFSLCSVVPRCGCRYSQH